MHIILLCVALCLARYPRNLNLASCTWQSKPQFTKVVKGANSVVLYWSVPANSGFKVTNYELQYATPNYSTWKLSTEISKIDWSNQSRILDILEEGKAYLDKYWLDFETAYLGKLRTTKVDLEGLSVYRFRVRSSAENCEWSDWSAYKVVSTSGIEWKVLEVQGTSASNALPAYIKLDGNYLYQSSTLKGLQVLVLHRQNLEVVFSASYNTFEQKEDSLALGSQLGSYDANYIVVLVSGDAWEWNFESTAAKALENLGAILVKEFDRSLPEPPSYKTVTQGYFRHPYCFLGIPELNKIAGQSLEVLRSNQSYYQYSEDFKALPTAKIRVNLLFDNLRQFYFIQTNNTWRRHS